MSNENNSMRNRSSAKKNTGSKAAGFVNVSFISKKRLDDSSLTVEDLIDGPLLSMSKGAALFGGAQDDSIMEKIVHKAYDDIERYLKEDTSHTVNDVDCPTLSMVKEVVLRVYSAERHEGLFGSASGTSDDDEF
jgi:hypothetical protein